MSETDNQNMAESQADPGAGAGEYSEESDLGIISSESRPRNTTAMLFLGLLMMGGGALYFMHLKAGPSAASASAEAAKASETISAFLKNDNKKAMNDLFSNTEKIVNQFLTYGDVSQVKLEELKTNPFRMAETAPDRTAEIEAEKARRLAEQQKEEAIKAASALKLQAILGGRVPKAMIGNKMYQEGQEIDGFVVEKISSSSVLVKRGQYKFELKMQ